MHNICKNCGSEILPKNDTPAAKSEAKRKKFCGHSCAATWNNKQFPKREAITEGKCLECGHRLYYKKMSNGSYSKKNYCDICRPLVVARKQREKGKRLGYAVLDKPMEDYTKGELRALSPNYNYFGSRMAKHARSVYMESDKPKECLACGYDYFVDVCHIKDISEFDEDELIGTINDLTNLVALCKNHHKEFDDKHITLVGMYPSG